MARQIASEYIRWNTNRKEALTLRYGVLSDPEIMMNAHHVPGTSFFIRDFRPDLFPLDSMSREKHKDKDLLSQVVAKMATLVAVNMAAGSFTVGTGDELIGYTPVRILQTDPTSCFWTDRVSKPMDADPSHYLMASMVLAKTRLLAGIMGMPQKDRDEIRDIYIAGLANSLRGLGSYALAHPHWWDHFGETPGARENLTGSRWDMRVQWPNVVDRINPRGKNYRNPGVVIRDVCLLASSIESCATKIFESGDSPEKQERTPEEKIRVLQPLIIALSVDPERPDEVLRVMEQNRFLANLITDEKRRRIELLAVRMAVERATTFGHFDPQQIDLFFRACIKDPKLKKAPKEVGENLARERFVGTKPPMEWGLHLTARYKELLFDAMLERNGEFRREMGEQGFLWPAPH
jgi:hypothetical protein